MDKNIKTLKILAVLFCFVIIYFLILSLYTRWNNYPPCPVKHPDAATSTAPVYTFKIVNSYPHDENAFTEGLVFENGVFFESTGIYRRSTLRKVDPETGDILAIHKLPPRLFGEGIVICKDKIIQLTYQSRLGLVYDKKTFRLLREFHYPTEGWGIAYDGKQLILSDGSSRLYLLDPETYKIICWIEVYDDKGPVRGLNELEYINGEIYANIFPTEHIAIIKPRTGEVTGWINLEGILDPAYPNRERCTLNGIAYDVAKKRLLVTGKYYPKIFEIELSPQ